MQERPVSDLAEIFDAEALVDEPGGRYSIAPTDEAIVVVERRDDRRALTGYRWGLIPHWAPDARIASRTFNARGQIDRIDAGIPGSFRRRRCLVPVDRSTNGGAWTVPSALPDLPGGRNPPRAGRPVGWLEEPGDGRGPPDLHDRDDDTERRGRQVHNRMPVIVPDEAWGRWLDPRPTDLGELRALLEPSTRSPSRSRRRHGSSTTCGTTAHSSSWRSTRPRQAPSRHPPPLRGRRRGSAPASIAAAS